MSRLKSKQEKRDTLFYGLPCVYHNSKYVLFSPYTKKALILDNLKDKEKIKAKIEKKCGKNFFGKPIFKKKDETYKKVTLITTTDCNLACKYCSVKAGEKKYSMSIKLAKRAIDEIINSKTKKIKIAFFGGEPTLNFKCIKETTNYVKKIGIPYEFTISTNGIISENIVDFLCKNNFIIQISADGIPEIQDYQRPLPKELPSSRILQKTIKRFVKKNAHFKIRETVTNLSVEKMAASVNYYAKLGVKFIFFEPLVSAGRAVGHKKIKCPKPNKFIKEFDKALNQAEKKGIQIGNSLLINLLDPSIHYCGAILGNALTITPHGLVTACTAIQDDCSNLSDIIITGKYDKANDKFRYYPNRIKHLYEHNVENIKKCSNCFAKYICSGGCVIRNLVKSGALEKTNEEYCEIRKGLLKLVILKMSGLHRKNLLK